MARTVAYVAACTLAPWGCGDPAGGGGNDGSSGAATTTSTDASSSGDPTSSAGTTAVADGSSSSSASDGSSGGSSSSGGTPGDPVFLFPRSSILASELAVLVDDANPASQAIADAYVQTRGIPAANVIHVDLPQLAVLTPEEFTPIRDDVVAQLGDDIQALALAWVTPYRVDCMSITSAFSFGHDPGYCGGCAETTPSPYYDSTSLAPWTDHGMRPTMMLAATSLEDAQALFDRGVASDGTHPSATGYLVRTTDVARSVRYPQMESLIAYWQDWDGLTFQYVDNADGSGSDLIENATDVMFYFTGLAVVDGIESNTYVPGAIADHLTSFGGEVPTSSQMSALRWLQVGATGSYGTVVEPCNYPAKFPHVGIATANYFRGQTLIEAYWKSVSWPGEGLFVGEPLARPWDGSQAVFQDGDLVVTTNVLAPGVDYDIQWADAAEGPWTTLFVGSIPATQTLTFTIENADHPHYRMVPQG